MVRVKVFLSVWFGPSFLNFLSQFSYVYSEASELPHLCSTPWSEQAVILFFKNIEHLKRPWGFEARDMGVWLGARSKTEYQRGNILCMKDLDLWLFLLVSKGGNSYRVWIFFIQTTIWMSYKRNHVWKIYILVKREDQISTHVWLQMKCERKKIIKGRVTFPIYYNKGSIGRGIQLYFRNKKQEATFLDLMCINTV